MIAFGLVIILFCLFLFDIDAVEALSTWRVIALGGDKVGPWL